LHREFIRAGNGAIEDTLLAQVMILGLPREYGAIKSITNTLKSDEATSKRVEEILIGEYNQKQIDKEDEKEDNSSGISVSRRNESDKTRYAGESRNCFKCGKTGHIQANCWKNEASKENVRRKNLGQTKDSQNGQKSNYRACTACLWS
jgi:hypothetical protein